MNKLVRFLLLAGFILLNISVLAQQSSYPTKQINGKEFYIYTVQQGEGLFSISRRFEVTQAEINTLNPEIQNGLKAGQKILIPVVKKVVPEQKSTTQTKAEEKTQTKPENTNNQEFITHTVKKRQTLFAISRIYGVSQDELRELNPEIQNGLKADMILKIPVKNKESKKNDEKAEFLLSALAQGLPFLHHEENSFHGYMKEFGQMFVGEEYVARLSIFVSNLRLIQEHNAAQNSFKLGLNHLCHLSPSEYRSLLGFEMTSSIAEATPLTNFKAPKEIDYRTTGIVNPIKDQGQCGSCWAFSSIQGVESQWAMVKGTLLSLSESNLVDCVNTCHGCNGGLMTKAYDYVLKAQNGQFMKESDYPYVPRQGACKFDANKAITKIVGYTSVSYGSEDDLMNKVASLGVADVAIDAGQHSFQTYHSGVYDEPKCSSWQLNHAVGCVGYGSLDGKDFWIVRNSWGTTWGDKGYIYMSRNKKNQCGIANMGLIPKL